MTFSTFEEAVTKTLGYKTLGQFADSTNLVTRSTISKWSSAGEISKLMSAYIEMRIQAEAGSNHNCQIIVGDKKVFISGEAHLFEYGDLIAHIVNNDFLSPNWDLGDIALCKPWEQKTVLEDGYWIFETEEHIRMFGVLVTQFDGTYRLYRDGRRIDSFQFGKEHLHRMRPVARAVQRIEKKG